MKFSNSIQETKRLNTISDLEEQNDQFQNINEMQNSEIETLHVRVSD